MLLMKVGGVQGRTSKGIHWHVDPNIQVRYLADATRETIYDVELIRADGSQELFRSRTKAPEDAVWRSVPAIGAARLPPKWIGELNTRPNECRCAVCWHQYSQQHAEHDNDSYTPSFHEITST